MMKSEIVVGGHYLAKVGSTITTVRVDKITETKGKPARVVPASPNGTGLGRYTAKAIPSVTYYDVTNLKTGRTATFRSATKFRRQVEGGVHVWPCGCKSPASGGDVTKVCTECNNDSISILCGKPLLGGLLCKLPSGHDGRCEGAKAIPVSAPVGVAAMRTGASLTSPGELVTQMQHQMIEQAIAAGGEIAHRIHDEAVMTLPKAKSEGEQRPDPTVPAAAAQPSPSATIGTPAATSPESKPRTTTSCGIAKAARVDADVPHVQLKALAGTGKTTSCVEGLKQVKGIGASVTPSPQQAEFWRQLGLGRSDTVRLSAFNTSITDELKARISACGLDKRGVEARGVHSLGNAAVYKAFGRMEASDWATKDLVCSVLGKDYSDLKKEVGMLVLVNAATDLVSLCKQNLCEPTAEVLDQLASHYDVDTGKHAARIAEVVPQVLELSKSPRGRIHFDDMVWLPLVLDLPVPQVDLQVIDEAQDLNRMQQELVYRGGRRVVSVGDEHQAIYGFAGADAESMGRMARTLGATVRGHVELPLTVTRRCGKAIVREAQQYVPEFEAHPSNPEGVVGEAKYPKQKNPHTGQVEDLPWAETYLSQVRDGAMVLCRVNAPLVSQCFRFLKHGIKAQIMGKKIGEGLVALVNKSNTEDVSSLRSWLADWVTRELEVENKKKFPSQAKLELVQDKADCLASFCEGMLRTADVAAKIKSVFTDAKAVRGVRLSSIHKSKGLEAEQVFFLQPPGTGIRCKSDWQRKQEDNLKYVAITRAISELVYVR